MKKREYGDKAMDGVLQVRDTIAIAHVIGCLLEDWFFKTEMVVEEKKVAAEVVVTKKMRGYGLEGETMTRCVNVKLLKKVAPTQFEVDYNPHTHDIVL